MSSANKIKELREQLRKIKLQNIESQIIIDAAMQNTDIEKQLSCKVETIVLSHSFDERTKQIMKINPKPLSFAESEKLERAVFKSISEKFEKVKHLEPITSVSDDVIEVKQKLNQAQDDYITALNNFAKILETAIESKFENLKLSRQKIEELNISSNVMLMKIELCKKTLHDKILKETPLVETAVKVAMDDLRKQTNELKTSIGKIEKEWNKLEQVDPSSQMGQLIANIKKLREHNKKRKKIQDEILSMKQ